MKKIKKLKSMDTIALRGGSYSIIITAIVLAIALVLNILVEVLPSSVTKYDISASQLYSVTTNTKMVLNNLEDDVNIYWIVQSGEEDQIIENLLNKYEELSEHIKVSKKNPDVFPTFTQQYTTEEVYNNSLIIECGERSRYIGIDDIYLQQTDLTSYSSSMSFDGEGVITSAIDYVVNEDQPKIYVLEGHGEQALPEAFQDQLTKANMESQRFSILNQDTIPEEADCVMIYGPESDISVEEQKVLHDYIKQGGKLFVAAGPSESSDLKNLYGLLTEFGVTTQEGIIVESDREHYAFRNPVALIPTMNSSEITDSLLQEHYYPVIPIAQGMTISENSTQTEVNPILTVQQTAFSKKAGFELSTYEKEEGDVSGPFTIGLSIAADNNGKIVWFSSTYFLEDMYNSYSAGANVELAMNALASMTGEKEELEIRTKSMDYDYLTISESTSNLLKTLLIGVFPIVYLGIGIIVVVRRREKRNEKI